MRYLMRLGCLCLLWAAWTVHAAAPQAQVRTVRGEFADIKARVVMALENRGLVLNYTARVGAMLERTGRDLGRDRRIYDKAEVLEFCSAALSRETMEADPRNIVYCPYSIAVYTLPRAPGTVHLAYRTVAAPADDRSARALRAIDELLAGVVSEALQ
jgi:uncharacterized protein (DUF302 family)